MMPCLLHGGWFHAHISSQYSIHEVHSSSALVTVGSRHPTHSCCAKLQDGALAVAHQLVGNNDEVTDLRFVGPTAAPTHVAIATNSPAIRLFDMVRTVYSHLAVWDAACDPAPATCYLQSCHRSCLVCSRPYKTTCTSRWCHL